MNTLNKKDMLLLHAITLLSIVQLSFSMSNQLFKNFDKLPKEMKIEILKQHIENELQGVDNIKDFQEKITDIKLISKEINELIKLDLLKKHIEEKRTDLQEALLKNVRGDTSQLALTFPTKTLEERAKISLDILNKNPQLKNNIYNTLNELINKSQDSDLLNEVANKSLVGKTKLESLYLQGDVYNLSDTAKKLLEKLLSK